MKCKVCLSNITKIEKYENYHDACFRKVFGTIKIDSSLPFSRNEFQTDRAKRNNRKFSISGVQPKLLLNIQDESLEVTETGGTHILKVSPEEYPFSAENEHLSMEIFKLMKIDTALCGLMDLKGGELSYITKRFDRESGKKIHQEDMMQAMGLANSGDSKYESKSYEEVGLYLFLIAKNLIVVGDFFKRVVLNFLIGNDDFHLKNISIRPGELNNGSNCLTPVYDSLNTELYNPEQSLDSELALDLVKNELGTTEHFDHYGFHTSLCFDEFAKKIGLNVKFTKAFYKQYQKSFPKIKKLVESSFLPNDYKEKYLKILESRYEKLFKTLVILPDHDLISK